VICARVEKERLPVIRMKLVIGNFYRRRLYWLFLAFRGVRLYITQLIGSSADKNLYWCMKTIFTWKALFFTVWTTKSHIPRLIYNLFAPHFFQYISLLLLEYIVIKKVSRILTNNFLFDFSMIKSSVFKCVNYERSPTRSRMRQSMKS